MLIALRNDSGQAGMTVQWQFRALASPGSRRGWKALPRDREEWGVARKQSREVALFQPYFTAHAPEEDFGMVDQYVEEINLKREFFEKAGRKGIPDIDTIIPAAIALDPGTWF